jgi:hypothetical protein
MNHSRDDGDPGGAGRRGGAQRGVQLGGAVGEPGQHGREEHPARQPGVGHGLDQVEPRARGRHARLERGVQSVVPDRHRDPEPDGHLLRRLDEQRDVAPEQRAFRQDGEGRARLGQGADDSGHQAITPLRPLVGIGIGAQGDVLVLPRGPGQLLAQDADEVRLDDYLRVEVTPGVELQPFMRAPSEAVMADHAVRDEVPGARGDVIHRHLEAEVLDAGHPQVGVALDGDADDRARAPDGRIDETDEAEMLTEATAQTDRLDAAHRPRVLQHRLEPDLSECLPRVTEHRCVCMADAEDVLTPAPLGVEDAGKEPAVPGRR